MSVSSGPQPGAGQPAVPVADPCSPPSPSSAVASTGTSPAQQPSTEATPHQPQPAAAEGQGEEAEDADAYESRHVHTVYEAIAPHFSSTRYKPWPLVASFLLSLPPGSVGLDAGCGNGKYIGVNPALYIIASDRSANLVSLARSYQPPHFDADVGGSKKKNKTKKGATTAEATQQAAQPAPAPAPPPSRAPRNQVLVADSLALPYRGAAFDFAISIAVIHHMSTRERRRAAVAALLDAVRPGTGRVLVMVWALEQGTSRRGWDAGAAQDQLVSWVTKGKKEQQDRPARDETFQRYYHLYREGELEEDVVDVGGRVLDSGYERDNWWAVFGRDS
ncbi:tRNA (cytidine(32)/guanosine(34)-2'-O)-methyltransferase [Colletotrichum spaethianum]|uniref:tRNA (Cytidine(32)/guanosine(34)-2'-O)-methyltransferase n=1 Tax=Colletotrichum spaethianum TaxID=700344 RepID=A0AA37UK45_9PEZI|nr:tRNA (cytidine(32)/guanosine(34)-2'-O)-methyltransferase [Colletotrichum spaethianum]GKT49366.1 tRNA (cytidine(32)/guanosine(34)-2'-O)-methyltransferase [Colletotrichum spaethianum]